MREGVADVIVVVVIGVGYKGSGCGDIEEE